MKNLAKALESTFRCTLIDMGASCNELLPETRHIPWADSPINN
jgi:hypothetical protein